MMKTILLLVLVSLSMLSCTFFGNEPDSYEDFPNDLVHDRFQMRHLDYDELNYTRGYTYDLSCHVYDDENGIQMRMYNGQLYYHPVASALDCLLCLEDYLTTDDERMLDYVSMTLHRFVEMSDIYEDAVYFPYEFLFMYHGTDAMMPNWYSAMSQGLFLSSFARMYYLTGDEWFYEQGTRVLRSFKQFDKDIPTVFLQDGYYWLDEYPVPNAEQKVRVLNGMIHAICGLYDWWWATGDETCRYMLECALTTIKDNIDQYRVIGGPSYYCLKYRVQDPNYHKMHTEQLTYLGHITGDTFFTDMALKFYGDSH